MGKSKKKPSKKGGKKTAMKANNLSRDVLGKKRKREERPIGLSRSPAAEKRRKLRQEMFEQCLESPGFMDKRVGEHNDEIGEFLKDGEESRKKQRSFSGDDLCDSFSDVFCRSYKQEALEL
ncbi:unnamed protein product [Arabis nemorensis]|uniref:Uncharacterized protein n=1 Tax=Arabis nemorensis TaxID=586526 RepID=A0A565C7I7_9BRAS|nr:unnamed protein product [Arabis nemorensis]